MHDIDSVMTPIISYKKPIIPYKKLDLYRWYKPNNNTDQLFGVMSGPGQSKDDGDWPTSMRHYIFWCAMTGTPEFKRMPFCNIRDVVRKKMRSGYELISLQDALELRQNLHEVMHEQFTLYCLTHEPG